MDGSSDFVCTEHVSTRGIISETTFLEEADVSTVSSDCVDETQFEDNEVQCENIFFLFETHARVHARARSSRMQENALCYMSLIIPRAYLFPLVGAITRRR